MDLFGIKRRRELRSLQAMIVANPPARPCPGCGLPIELHTEIGRDLAGLELNAAALRYHRTVTA